MTALEAKWLKEDGLQQWLLPWDHLESCKIAGLPAALPSFLSSKGPGHVHISKSPPGGPSLHLDFTTQPTPSHTAEWPQPCSLSTPGGSLERRIVCRWQNRNGTRRVPLNLILPFYIWWKQSSDFPHSVNLGPCGHDEILEMTQWYPLPRTICWNLPLSKTRMPRKGEAS